MTWPTPNERTTDQTIALALTVMCAACSQPAGKPCIARNGGTLLIPHAQRVADADLDQEIADGPGIPLTEGAILATGLI